MISAGKRSGVNWRRLNPVLIHAANVRTDRVFAKPGTPSSNRWPLVSNPINKRVTKPFWPTTTLDISASSGSIQLPTALTFSVISSVDNVITPVAVDTKSLQGSRDGCPGALPRLRGRRGGLPSRGAAFELAHTTFRENWPVTCSGRKASQRAAPGNGQAI